MNPKISIICGVWNEEKTFEKHMESLVNQTYKNKEVIIVDDGSTDKTSEIGRKFAEKYKFVKYIFINHKEGYGCVRPRLEGIKNSQGEVLCIVDADGYYEQNNLEDGVNTLFSNDKIAAVVPRMHAWNPNNFIARYRAMVYESRFVNSDLINKDAGLGKYSPWLIKRKVYDEVGGYNINDAYCEDLLLASKVLSKGYKIVHEPKCHWYHNLGDSVFDVISKNFNIGKMHATERNSNKWNLLKVSYFSLPFCILILGFLNSLFLILMVLHPVPMLFNSFIIFFKIKGVKGRMNSFYSPFVSYFVNLPYSLGFYSGIVRPYKK